VIFTSNRYSQPANFDDQSNISVRRANRATGDRPKPPRQPNHPAVLSLDGAIPPLHTEKDTAKTAWPGRAMGRVYILDGSVDAQNMWAGRAIWRPAEPDSGADASCLLKLQ